MEERIDKQIRKQIEDIQAETKVFNIDITNSKKVIINDAYYVDDKLSVICGDEQHELVIGDKIKYLRINIRRGWIVDLSMASNLEYLDLCYVKNDDSNEDDSLIPHEIKIWPTNLKYLLLGGTNYNKPLDNLPLGLLYLEVPSYFNYPLNNLPYGLIGLEINNFSEFTHPLDMLPYSLRWLKFGCYCEFNHSLDNLPLYLEVLDIKYHHNYDITNMNFPLELKALIIHTHIVNRLPANLEFLSMCFELHGNSNKFNQQQLEMVKSLKYLPNFKELHINNEMIGVAELVSKTLKSPKIKKEIGKINYNITCYKEKN